VLSLKQNFIPQLGKCWLNWALGVKCNTMYFYLLTGTELLKLTSEKQNVHILYSMFKESQIVAMQGKDRTENFYGKST
jgi:hypothetical protein